MRFALVKAFLPKVGKFRLLVRVRVVLVVGELLVKEFVNDSGDICNLTIFCLHPDLVPPSNIGFNNIVNP